MKSAVLGWAVCGFLMLATPAARRIGQAPVTAGDPLQPLTFLIGRPPGGVDAGRSGRREEQHKPDLVDVDLEL
jgi:hypothetical protein